MAGRGKASQLGWDLLKIPNLRWLWAAQTISQIGDGLTKVALIWLVYSLTGSALKTTTIGVLQTVPSLLAGPFAGVYVDRLPKKRIMITVDLLRSGLILVIPALQAMQLLTLPRLYIVVLLMALVSTIFTPALESVIPVVVERPQLTAANALINSTAMLGVLLGPAISGVGISTIGVYNVLFLSAGTFLLSVVALWRLHLKADQHERHPSTFKQFMDAFKRGIRYAVIERKSLGAFVLSGLVYSLAASAFVFLLPVFAKDVLDAGAMTLGWLWSSYGAGMVAVSLSLAFVPQPRPYRRLLIPIVALAGGGVGALFMAGADGMLPAVGWVALVGAGLASFTPIVWGLLQEMTPQQLRGRIFGLFNTGAMAASVIGMVGFGWATDALGPRVPLFGMAAILWSSALALLLLRQFGDLTPAEPSTGTR